ncbi:MAG: acetyl-CoA carboxylase biotin carboxylase subunit [Thermoflexales bacterium]|nr:acetyl-CoA carboxylase biotin carboxylase subunit [Thermoflexales bacterium]
MFSKILIANRGEIAVRIVRACRELGVRTVAVYSNVDRDALHVRYADEAYPIGPAPASDSYLRIDKILDVARKSGADAVHPGYGFLAERPDFAQACADAGLTFIGPPATAIGAMGDKAVARATAQEAGVPLVPGTEGEGALRDEELLAAAPKIGFPLLVKAAAGGGGKGTRLVQRLEELPPALVSARREAESAFGEGAVYLEKVIEGARRIDIQLLADQHGNVIHLGEREGSIHRRHQKLLEEAPSPALDDELRARMGAVAVRAAQAIQYVNAGAVVFLLDQANDFFFLEMRTRLQAGHPVTEMVTGVDIVKEQIRIARGRKLRYSQADVRLNGRSIGCRIHAEDPFNNFMPSTGKITRMVRPTGPGVRWDGSVYEGCEITPYYDSLLAKVMAWGETRAEAILRMRRALQEQHMVGIKTNVPFFQSLIDSHRFMAGQFDMNFVDQRFSMVEDIPAEWPYVAAIMATLAAHQRNRQAMQIRRFAATQDLWKWGDKLW